MTVINPGVAQRAIVSIAEDFCVPRRIAATRGAPCMRVLRAATRYNKSQIQLTGFGCRHGG